MLAFQIIGNGIGKRKLCARFVRHALTAEHDSDVFLMRFEMVQNKPNYFLTIMTGDETCLFTYNQETRRTVVRKKLNCDFKNQERVDYLIPEGLYTNNLCFRKLQSTQNFIKKKKKTF